MKLFNPAAFALLVSTLLVVPAHAAEWGAGIGVISLGSEFEGVDTRSYILPIPYYRGERLTVNLDGLSYTLLQSAAFQISAQIRGRFDGFDPEDSTVLADLRERKAGIDGGISITSINSWGIAELSLLADISGTSNGRELALAYQYPVEIDQWTITPELGIKVGNVELVDYYYGVDASEEVAGRPAYETASAVDTYFSTSISYQLSTQSTVLLGFEHTQLDDVKQNSPIVDQGHNTNVIAAYIFRLK